MVREGNSRHSVTQIAQERAHSTFTGRRSYTLQRREGKIFVAGSKLDSFNTVAEAKEETRLTVSVHALESSCSAFTEKKENFIAQRIILLFPMMRPLE
jgi:hypothetical protein